MTEPAPQPVAETPPEEGVPELAAALLPEDFPEVDVASVVARKPSQSSSRGFDFRAGGKAWSVDWRSEPLSRFTPTQLEDLRRAAREHADFEFRIVGPRREERISERVAKAPKPERERVEAARSDLEQARAALADAHEAVGAARSAHEEALAARDAARKAYATGAGPWKACEGAAVELEKAEVKLEGAQGSAEEAAEAFRAACRALAEAEHAALVAALAPLARLRSRAAKVRRCVDELAKAAQALADERAAIRADALEVEVLAGLCGAERAPLPPMESEDLLALVQGDDDGLPIVGLAAFHRFVCECDALRENEA